MMKKGKENKEQKQRGRDRSREKFSNDKRSNGLRDKTVVVQFIVTDEV